MESKIFRPKDKVIVFVRGGKVETFITKVVTSEYIDADGSTITTRRIYYTDATGGTPLDKGITLAYASDKEKNNAQTIILPGAGTQTC